MDYSTRSDLIGALAESFNKSSATAIETSNYIENTGTMDCSAMGLDISTLKKTSNVIDQHIALFYGKETDPEKAQYIMHLKIAKKCVEEIILLKTKKEK